MTVVEYEISAAKLARASVRQVEHVGHRGARLFVGLSPFEVPTGAEIEVGSNDELVLQLEYPNSEPAEQLRRSASADHATTVTLGVTTRKILAVHVRNASVALETGVIPFDPAFADKWAEGLPAHEVSTCQRSANLICQVLQEMPADLRQMLLRRLRAVRAQSELASR